MLVFSSAKDFDIIKIEMTSLIIDAANEVIFLKIISNGKHYTNEYSNSRENFDRFGLIVFDFLKKKNVKLADINQIFVNQGPGNYSGIRISITACKAISFSNNINLYGFDQNQIKEKNYDKILDLFKKGVLIKDIIKPIYK